MRIATEFYFILFHLFSYASPSFCKFLKPRLTRPSGSFGSSLSTIPEVPLPKFSGSSRQHSEDLLEQLAREGPIINRKSTGSILEPIIKANKFAVNNARIASEKSIVQTLNADESLFKGVNLPGKKLSAEEFRGFIEKRNNLKTISNNYQHKYKFKTQKKINLDKLEENLKITFVKIYTHNVKAQNGNSSFEMGVNQFSHMSYEEFASVSLGYQPSITFDNQSASLPNDFAKIPSKLDWRKKGIVSPVKEQGLCSSCITFSAIGCLESAHARRHRGQMLDLSEQELVDCSQGNGNNGCNSGKFEPTFNYLQNRGVGSEMKYHYRARVRSTCYARERVTRLSKWSHVLPRKNETVLRDAIANYGPVALGLHVNEDFKNYYKGIFDSPCSGQGNHAVLAAGYGRKNNTLDYWIIKNSWGEEFGESGFIRIRRNYGNLCGIANEAIAIEEVM